MTRRCGSCDFFNRDGDGAGECRRQPPNTLQIAESGSGIVGADRGPAIRLRSYWPPVAASAWCGEWKEKGDER